jgi:CheY-like chemotaxis protein
VATILIVDDEEPLREFLVQMLTAAGHRTLEAVHGADALDIIERERPDLVVSDIMMPILTGVELCRRLKARTETAVIPVILMSSTGPRAAEGAGADAFIAKPFDLDAMEALIVRWASPDQR